MRRSKDTIKRLKMYKGGKVVRYGSEREKGYVLQCATKKVNEYSYIRYIAL